MQILSFNLGVEFGQIAVLLIVFLLIKMIGEKLRRNIANFTNWALVVAGSCLLIFQLHGYFTDHNHKEYIEMEEIESKPHNHGDEHEHVHPKTH